MMDSANVPRSEWDRPPWNRWAFQHVADFLPTVRISRGSGPVRELALREQDLDGLQVSGLGGQVTSLVQFLEESFTDGFLVLKDGTVAYERYLNGMDATRLHLSQSVAKSFVGALTGILARKRLVNISGDVAA